MPPLRPCAWLVLALLVACQGRRAVPPAFGAGLSAEPGRRIAITPEIPRPPTSSTAIAGHVLVGGAEPGTLAFAPGDEVPASRMARLRALEQRLARLSTRVADLEAREREATRLGAGAVACAAKTDDELGARAFRWQDRIGRGQSLEPVASVAIYCAVHAPRGVARPRWTHLLLGYVDGDGPNPAHRFEAALHAYSPTDGLLTLVTFDSTLNPATDPEYGGIVLVELAHDFDFDRFVYWLEAHLVDSSPEAMPNASFLRFSLEAL